MKIDADINGSYNILRKNNIDLTFLQKEIVKRKERIEAFGITL